MIFHPLDWGYTFIYVNLFLYRLFLLFFYRVLFSFLFFPEYFAGERRTVSFTEQISHAAFLGFPDSVFHLLLVFFFFFRLSSIKCGVVFFFRYTPSVA